MTKRQKQYLLITAICLAATTFIVFLLLSWSTNYNYCVSHSGAHDSGQYYPNGHPILTVSLDHPGAIRLFAHCLGAFTDQHANALTAVSTVLLTFITFGLVILGWMQFSTSRAQLRAYVGVDTASIFDSTPPLMVNWPYVNMNVKNTGETPARNVRNWIRLEVGPVTNPTLPNIVVGDIAGASMASGAITVHNWQFMSRQLAGNEITSIQAGMLAIYVYGMIKYTDVFGKDRESHYRLLHTGSWPPATGAVLLFAPEGNSFT